MKNILDNIRLYFIIHLYNPAQQKFMFECVKSEVGISGMGRTLLDFTEKERPKLKGFQRWLFKSLYPELKALYKYSFKKAYEETLGEPFDTID
jgi:hypothetical protein